jgi:hypothetical protein
VKQLEKYEPNVDDQRELGAIMSTMAVVRKHPSFSTCEISFAHLLLLALLLGSGWTAFELVKALL